MKPILYVHNPLQKWVEGSFVLLCGGVAYYGLELLMRGYSHWSMALCGAICFYFIYRVNAMYPHTLLPVRALYGALFITTVELIAGCWVNLRLGLNVWDYSNLPFHFMGQICLLYSLIWFLLCFPLSPLCRLIRRRVFLSDV